MRNVVKCKNNEELTTYDNLVTIDLPTGTNLSCAIELCLHVTNIIKTRVQIRYNLTAFISRPYTIYTYISVDETDSSPMGVLLWVHKPSPNTTPQCTEYQILKLQILKRMLCL